MSAREYYARATVGSDVECSIGLEVRSGDDVEQLTWDLKAIATAALTIHGGHHQDVAAYVELKLLRNWKGRAYFIETEEDGRGVQVYQPFGMPRGS